MKRSSDVLLAAIRAASPFLITGTVAIVVGGVLSSIVATRPSYLGSWAVAYLVLVAGVAQIVYGAGLAHFSRPDALAPSLRIVFILFNLGHAGVLTGSLLQHRVNHSELLVDFGSLLLAGSMLLGITLARGAPPSRGRTLYELFLAALLVCVLIGVALTYR